MAESCPSSLEPTAGSGFDLEPTRCQLFHQLDQIWSRSAGRSHRQTHCQPTICTRWKHSDLFPDNYLVFLFFFLGFILVLIFNCVFSTILSMVYHPQFELWSNTDSVSHYREKEPPTYPTLRTTSSRKIDPKKVSPVTMTRSINSKQELDIFDGFGLAIVH